MKGPGRVGSGRATTSSTTRACWGRLVVPLGGRFPKASIRKNYAPSRLIRSAWVVRLWVVGFPNFRNHSTTAKRATHPLRNVFDVGSACNRATARLTHARLLFQDWSAVFIESTSPWNRTALVVALWLVRILWIRIKITVVVHVRTVLIVVLRIASGIVL